VPLRKTIHDVRYTERALKPYVSAIGQLSLAWNDLHEQLAAIFHVLLDRGVRRLDERGIELDTDERPIKLWNSAKFDRPKRELLRAAIETVTDEERESFPKLLDDLTWLLKRADALEDARNDAVHSPLMYIGSARLMREAFGSMIMPNLLYGNPRGTKLAKKDLLNEFRWCRDSALALRDFANLISGSLALGTVALPWPDRPSLPNRGEKKTSRQAQSRPAPRAARSGG
jgi:hypothetical protein